MIEETIAAAINLSPLTIWMVVGLIFVVRGKWSVLNRRCLLYALVAVPLLAAFTVYFDQSFVVLAVAVGWGLLLVLVELWMKRRRTGLST